MPVDVIMPKVDMDMANGTIAQWHAQEGDSVTQGDPLFDIETDKSTMEVEAPATGVLHQVSAQIGDAVDIGVCIAQIFAQGEAIELHQSANDAQENNAKAENNTLDLNTSQKNTNRQLNPLAGKPVDAIPHKQPPENNGRVRATPLARKLAEQHALKIDLISGSGPAGRITKADVLNEAQIFARTKPAVTERSDAIVLKNQLASLGVPFTSEPVDRMRSTIATRLTESKSSVPHFYVECDCRIDKLQSYRHDINQSLVNSDVRISLNDLLVRAAAKVLEEVPEANIAWAGSELIRYSNSDMSIAVSVPGGLMTPVVRAAQKLSITQLSSQIGDLSARAKAGKLSPSECQGGSMSVSNLGMYGVQKFQAIINPPQSMILAIGAATRQFVPDENDQPMLAQLMSVCLSCDHRALDGVIAARWLQVFRERIENPVSLLI